MDNKDKLAVPNTSTAWFDYVSRSKQKTETPTRVGTIDSDTLRGTSRMKAYPVIKTQFSWTQRVLSYFRKVEAFGATSGVKVYKYIRTRVSWKQRVLSWFSKH